jgi:hypothetical protein
MRVYSDKEIFMIINYSCGCHPYVGPRCDKCNRMDSIWQNQIEDLRRLVKAGKLRIIPHSSVLEVVNDTELPR